MLEVLRHLWPSSHEHDDTYKRLQRSRQAFRTLGRITMERREAQRRKPTPPLRYQEGTILPGKYLNNGMYANRDVQATTPEPITANTSDIIETEAAPTAPSMPMVQLYDIEAESSALPADTESGAAEPVEAGPTNIEEVVTMRTHGLASVIKRAAIVEKRRQTAEVTQSAENQPPIPPS